MAKITTIGSALIDLYFTSNDFIFRQQEKLTYLCQAYGQKMEMSDYQLTTGGAASNAAVAFARRAHEVSIIAEMGNDVFSQMIKSELEREGVISDYLIIEEKEQTGCSVILRGSDGGRSIMVSRSAANMLDDYDIPLDYLLGRDWLYLSSLGGNLNALSEIWQVFEHQSNIGFTWNPGKKELQALAANKLSLPTASKSIFVVNAQEWEIVKALQEKILQQFVYVVITAGKAQGEVYFQGQKAATINPSQEPAIEETGAGDAFSSAFTSTIIYGRPLEEAIQAGLNNAQSVIKYVGAKQGLLSY